MKEKLINAMFECADETKIIDLEKALSDSLSEKYEYMYVELVRICKDLHGGDPEARGWMIVASPEICSIFESATAGFDPKSLDKPDGVYEVGTVNGRWKLVCAPNLDANEMIVAVGNPPRYAAITLTNFVD